MTSELVSVITQEVYDLHQAHLRGEPGGVRLETVAGPVKIEIDLSYANLSNADLSVADLRGADLSYANLSVADLRGADLSYANLSHANLSHANLSNANLRNADLSHANLSNANLRNADLRYANLSGANLDFSAWPLWCGSNHVKVDARLAAKLAAHFCALDCDDPAYQAARAAVLSFATTSHRAGDLGLTSQP